MEKRLQNLIWDKGIKYFVKKKKIRRNIMKLGKKYKCTRNKMKISLYNVKHEKKYAPTGIRTSTNT